MSNACDRFLDDLAAVVNGDHEILSRHLDHLSECDACRDARHEAQAVASAVRAAGADFVAPADLEARVLDAIDQVQPQAATQPEIPVPQVAAPQPAPIPTARPAPTRRRWRGLIAGASLAAAAATVAIVVASGGGDSEPAGTASAAAAWTGSIAVIDRAAEGGASGVEIKPAGASAFAPANEGGDRRVA